MEVGDKTATAAENNHLDKFLNCLANFQYDKAKTYIDKLKDSNRVCLLLQNGLNYFLNGEKSYTNLLFLGHKSATKQDRNFEPAWNQLDQAIRECNNVVVIQSDNQSMPGGVSYSDIVDTCHLLICFTEFRFQMISLYVDLKDRNVTSTVGSGNSLFTSITTHLDSVLKNLSKIEEKFGQKFTNNKHVFSLYTLEVQLLKNVLECHLAIDHKLDCIKALTTLKDIGDLFDTKLPNGSNSKQSKESKSFSLFLRGSSQQRTLPVLYQWFKLYHGALFGKFSLIMHDSLNRVIQRDHLMNDKVDILSKLTGHVKKAGGGGFCCVGLILESSRSTVVNFRGNGYEMPHHILSDDESGGQLSFSSLFFYPRIEEPLQERLIKTLSSQLTTPDLDHKIKSFFDQTQRLTYYFSKVSENLVFFLVNESKTKVVQFAQEVSDDLNLSNVLNCFNANLR